MAGKSGKHLTKEAERDAGVDDLHRHLTDTRIGAPVRLGVLRRFDRLELIAVPEEFAARK